MRVGISRACKLVVGFGCVATGLEEEEEEEEEEEKA
jgi:hypothetical protein